MKKEFKSANLSVFLQRHCETVIVRDNAFRYICDCNGASFNIALTNNLLIVESDEPKLMFHCDLDEASIRLCDNEKKAYLDVGTKTFRITLFFSPVETPHYNVVHLGSRRP